MCAINPFRVGPGFKSITQGWSAATTLGSKTKQHINPERVKHVRY